MNELNGKEQTSRNHISDITEANTKLTKDLEAKKNQEELLSKELERMKKEAAFLEFQKNKYHELLTTSVLPKVELITNACLTISKDVQRSGIQQNSILKNIVGASNYCISEIQEIKNLYYQMVFL